MKIRKLFALTLSALLVLSLLTSCKDGETDGDDSSTDSVTASTEQSPSSESSDSSDITSSVTSMPAQSEIETPDEPNGNHGGTTPGTPNTPNTPNTPTTSTPSNTTVTDNTVEPLEVKDTIEIPGVGKAVLYKFNSNVYKLEIPFSGIYTSVFMVRTKTGSNAATNEWVFIDTGTTGNDVTNYVIPAAEGSLNINLRNVKGILLTHTHGDHAGGLKTLAPRCPSATVYGVAGSNADAGSNVYRQATEGMKIEGVIEVVTIKGHDYDACGYIDTRSKSLIAGDSLQLYGIASWGCQVRHIDAYYESLEKLQKMDIENIFVAHAYVPSGAYALGKTAVAAYIGDSIECLTELIRFTTECYSSGTTDVAQIQQKYVAAKKNTVKNFPGGGFDVAIQAIINQKLK